jgi:ribonucleoside-triphosphate reductase
MLRLSNTYLQKKVEFIENYVSATNAATGSLIDPNANIEQKTTATLGSEVVKDIYVQLNVYMMKKRIGELFGEGVVQRFEDTYESHLIYLHDFSRSSIYTPYCAAVTLYPMLAHGLKTLNAESNPPKHLDSFCGAFVNLVFAVSSSFAGAVATPEMLLYFHHFATKDFGAGYLKEVPEIIKNNFQQIIYSLNSPAGNRGLQKVFWNISFFDRNFYDAFFKDFHFPGINGYGSHNYSYDSYNELQKFFMEWLKEERKKTLLTFPVITEASIDKDGEPLDKDWADWCAEMRSQGLSFFSYNSESVDSLSSCCRLRNAIEDNAFSFSLGFSGVKTGSVGVITLNLNRLAQKHSDSKEDMFAKLPGVISDIHKYHVALRSYINEAKDAGLLPVYDAGYIDLDKQFSTIGISGINEMAEFYGMEVSNNPEYIGFCQRVLKAFKDQNIAGRKEHGVKFNTEFVPGEGLGVKNQNWDKKDGLAVNGDRIAYNSYLYLPESDTTSLPDKFKLHGSAAGFLDGGQALHANLAHLPDKEFFLWLRGLAAKYHTNYWTTNVKQTFCGDCGHIDYRTLNECPKCGSTKLEFGTRVIGYAKKISSFSEDRQNEEAMRFYH